MVGLDQHTVGDDAIEHLTSRRHGLRPVHVEGRLPIGIAREQVRITHGIAHRQHGLIA